MHNTSNSEPMARVLSLVRGIKRAGHGWKAQCPAHDDKTPSLSITQGDNGCVLLKCHAGCETRAVVAALGLKESDLFEPTERTRTTPRPKPVKKLHSFASAKEAADAYRATHKKETARWVYRDADGAPVGLVMRWDTSDGTKNIRPVWRIGDGWQHSIPSEQRPLYALDRLVADAEARRDAGAERFDQHVGLAGETQEIGATLLALEVEHDALFVAVDPHEVTRFAVNRVVVGAGKITRIAFNLDDTGTEIAQLARCEGRSHRLLERHDEDAVKWSGQSR